jgi:hypothetical protein
MNNKYNFNNMDNNKNMNNKIKIFFYNMDNNKNMNNKNNFNNMHNNK